MWIVSSPVLCPVPSTNHIQDEYSTLPRHWRVENWSLTWMMNALFLWTCDEERSLSLQENEAKPKIVWMDNIMVSVDPYHVSLRESQKSDTCSSPPCLGRSPLHFFMVAHGSVVPSSPLAGVSPHPFSGRGHCTLLLISKGWKFIQGKKKWRLLQCN